MFEPEVFRKEMYCFEKYAYHLAPRSDSAPGELCPLAPSLRLWCFDIKIGNFFGKEKI